MSFTDENGNKCACSRNRQCAMHRAEAKKRARVAEQVYASTRVQVGIEELRARYGTPQGHRRAEPVKRRPPTAWKKD